MSDDQTLLREFGDRLRHARTDKGLSQETLSHAAGLHRTYVGAVERGERNITLLNILTLATTLGVDPATLVQGMARGPKEKGLG